MRKIDKSKVRVPSKLVSKECFDRIEHSILNVGTHTYSNAYYADHSVHRQLNKLYNGKCAFCESDVRAGSAVQIDHYRPKNGVIEEPMHRGYYWLGYEWTNLLPICAKCNRSKTHSFPIDPAGLRQYSHPSFVNGSFNSSEHLISSQGLLNEQPLIVNPEIADPANYFMFIPSGKIKGKGQYASDETIRICSLNRKDLRLARKKLRDDLLRSITQTLSDYHSGVIIKETATYSVYRSLLSVLDIYSNNGPYSIYCLHIIKHFEYFIARRFKTSDKNYLMNVYGDFLKNCRNQLT